MMLLALLLCFPAPARKVEPIFERQMRWTVEGPRWDRRQTIFLGSFPDNPDWIRVLNGCGLTRPEPNRKRLKLEGVKRLCDKP